MRKGKSDKITYKPYEQNQQYLIPPSADELIPNDHLVRLVSEVIDEMGIERQLRRTIRSRMKNCGFISEWRKKYETMKTASTETAILKNL